MNDGSLDDDLRASDDAVDITRDRSTEHRSGMLPRALDVLSAFRPSDLSLPPAELAKRAGLSKATGHRIIRDMIELGFLERTTGGVRLGMRMFEIGQLVPRQRNLRSAALPYMHDLRKATQATVHLAVLDRTDVLYIDILGQDADLPSRIGGRLPAHATGVGKAMLAFAPSYVVDAVLSGPLDRYSPATITSRDELEQELMRARKWGIAYDREESLAGIVCAAAALLSKDGALLGGLSVTSRVGSMNLQQVGPAVHTAALALGRALDQEMGWPRSLAPIVYYDELTHEQRAGHRPHEEEKDTR